jgi:hypothetical protein
MFGRVISQWKRDAAGHPAGLDYQAVIAFLSLYVSPRRQPRLMADIRLIELGALDAVAKKAAENGA